MDGMDHIVFNITLLVLAIIGFIVVCVATADEIKMTTCRLAFQVVEGDQRVCAYVGANNTRYDQYHPKVAGECPREYQCPYRPNEKPFNLKNVIQSIKESF